MTTPAMHENGPQHPTWCIREEQESQCVGVERKTPVSWEDRITLSDGSRRHPYMTAYLALEEGETVVFVGYDESAGHHLTPDEAQKYACDLLLLVARARGQI